MIRIIRPLCIASAWIFLAAGVGLTSIASWHFLNLLAPNTPTALLQPTILSLSPTQDETTESAGKVKGMETIAETEDGRAELVTRFLKRYKSPLQPYDYWGTKFVEIADRYNIDFRLLPAIAMQESNLCKNMPPATFNCLGFGIHERGTLAFESYEANFERAAKELKKNYIDEGLTTPEAIMTKYTPGSKGSWADSVNQWMAEMRYDDRQLGIQSEDDANVLEFVEETP
jgi:hypothetical protein